MNGLPEIKGFDTLWQQYDQSVSQWRKEFKQRLSAADNIFCPSKSTAKIYKSHYALKNIQVKAHPEAAFKIKPREIKAEKGIINIALIGAIGDHKGSQLLLECAKHALKEGLPLNFVLIRYSNIDEELSKLDNVTLTGEYKNAEQLKQEIQAHQCQMALFLSAWPETFCYTLTEALENNLYPVALNYGAIAERIKKLKFGMTLSTDLQAKEINKKLMSAAKKASKIEGVIEYKGAKYPDIIKDYYLMDV
jgi:glycosyltransferase involved in cell wall biosynthesis